MVFYHLDQPRYETDQAWLESLVCDTDYDDYLALPGVTCPECGSTWANRGLKLSTNTLANRSLLRQILGDRKGPVPYTTYEQIVAELRKVFQLPQTVNLVPGMRLGLLPVRIQDLTKMSDFNWCRSGEVVITQKVVDLLSAASVTGYKTLPILVANSSFTLPPLQELVVTGHGGPLAAEAGTKLASVCAKCGRKQYEIVYESLSGRYWFHGLYVDTTSWDGSDIFLFKELPTTMMITERVKDVLLAGGLNNYTAYPAPLGGYFW